jgi:hypothetical protein
MPSTAIGQWAEKPLDSGLTISVDIYGTAFYQPGLTQGFVAVETRGGPPA